MARGRLRLSLRPSPRPRLILTSCTDMDSDTMDMDSDTMVDTSDTMADSDTMARGLLAEADPYLLYGGHLGYGHLGYAGHLGYYGHGLGYYRYGKRSADAEA